jgi:hypothetical protein
MILAILILTQAINSRAVVPSTTLWAGNARIMVQVEESIPAGPLVVSWVDDSERTGLRPGDQILEIGKRDIRGKILWRRPTLIDWPHEFPVPRGGVQFYYLKLRRPGLREPLIVTVQPSGER